MSNEEKTQKTGSSGIKDLSGVGRGVTSPTRPRTRENRTSWRSEATMTPSDRRKAILDKMDNVHEKHVPVFTTVMGKGGKILLNVYPNNQGQREVQIFFNKGRRGDGRQLSRSCLRNMLSIDFQKVIAVNAYHGFFLAIQTSHSDESVHGYHTDKKYKSNIGLLEYVALDDIEDFADECSAIISPKVREYLDEVRNYIDICKEVAGCF